LINHKNRGFDHAFIKQAENEIKKKKTRKKRAKRKERAMISLGLYIPGQRIFFRVLSKVDVEN